MQKITLFRMETLSKVGAFQTLPITDNIISIFQDLPESTYLNLPNIKYGTLSKEDLLLWFPYESILYLMEHNIYLTTYKLPISDIYKIDQYQVLYTDRNLEPVRIECPSTLYSY